MSKGFYCFGNAQVVRPNEVAEFIDEYSVPVEEFTPGRYRLTADENSSYRLLCDYSKDFYSDKVGRSFNGGFIYTECDVEEIEIEDGTLLMIDGEPFMPYDKVGAVPLVEYLQMMAEADES